MVSRKRSVDASSTEPQAAAKNGSAKPSAAWSHDIRDSRPNRTAFMSERPTRFIGRSARAQELRRSAEDASAAGYHPRATVRAHVHHRCPAWLVDPLRQRRRGPIRHLLVPGVDAEAPELRIRPDEPSVVAAAQADVVADTGQLGPASRRGIARRAAPNGVVRDD